VQRLRLKSQRTLQRLQQSNVLGDIIILAPDRSRDSDGAVYGATDDHSNTRRAGIPARAAIDVSHEI